MSECFLLLEVDGRSVPVTLDEILAFLREDEREDFKDLIAISREDQWRIVAAADEDGLVDAENEEVIRASERLAENALFLYLIVQHRIGAHLRVLDRTPDTILEGG